MALLDQEHGLTGNLAEKMGKDRNAEQAVSEELGKLPTFNGLPEGLPPAEDGQVLVRSDDEAKQLGDEYVSVEHLLLAILEEGKGGSAGRLLRAIDPPQRTAENTEEVRGGRG